MPYKVPIGRICLKMKQKFVFLLMLAGLLSCGKVQRVGKPSDGSNSQLTASCADRACSNPDDFCFIVRRGRDGQVLRSRCMAKPNDCNQCNCLSTYLKTRSDTKDDCSESLLCGFDDNELIVKCDIPPSFEWLKLFRK